MIYFVTSHDDPNGLVKIGYTKGDVEVRLAALQTGSPVRLAVLATVDGGRQEELRLHECFARSRAHGEWFWPSQEIRDFIHGLTHGVLPSLVEEVFADPERLQWIAEGADLSVEEAKQRLFALVN
jgi:hypothetical protein